MRFSFGKGIAQGIPAVDGGYSGQKSRFAFQFARDQASSVFTPSRSRGLEAPFDGSHLFVEGNIVKRLIRIVVTGICILLGQAAFAVDCPVPFSWKPLKRSD